MKQDIENQYDDDLTLGSDEYDDSYYTDADDLFEFSTTDESPISRLKSLVLSIDWEITDEVLLQFNEELIDLKGIWAGNSINLVYIQALEKISKYIYQNKANSHPNSIKLLLTLYYNLEKIVSSEDLSEAQKKEILLEDVKRFEALKRQISQKPQPAQGPAPARPQTAKVKKDVAAEDKLLNLKAIVLGIDWEITDQDLNDLRREVLHLEEQFADSRPKLILLQGIGTLGAYIKTKKSNAHADAFKVLHLFYESLEKIVKSPKTLEEEKAILFPAVEKFNEFKALLGPTISPEAIDREEDEEEEEFEESSTGDIAPALADVSDEETIGFQADEEAKSLGLDNSSAGVSSQIDSFFGESVPPAAVGDKDHLAVDSGELFAKEEAPAAGFESPAVSSSVDKEVALQGVDVGTDDEEEDAGDYEPVVAALADTDEGVVSEWEETSAEPAAEVALAMEDEQPTSPASDEDIAKAADSLFPDSVLPAIEKEQVSVDREVALQGVNVETEADEDSDELSLPMEGEEIAPALVASEEESLFSAETLESNVAEGIGEEITGTLDDLFIEEKRFPASEPEKVVEEKVLEATETGSFQVEEKIVVEEIADEFDAEPLQVPADDRQLDVSDTVVEKDDANVAIQEEEALSLFFEGSDFEQSAEESAAVDSLFESLEPALIDEPASAEIDEISAVAVDDVIPAEEEISFKQEEAPPVEEVTEEEIAPAEDVPVEEEIDLLEGEVSSAEEDISFIKEEIPGTGEDISLVEEPPAEEAIPSFEDEAFPVENGFSEAAEEVVPTVGEVSLAEEISSLEEEISPAVESSPIEEVSFDAEEVLPAEEDLTAVVAAQTPPAEEYFGEEEVVFELANEAEAESGFIQPVVPTIETQEFAFADEVAGNLPPAFPETLLAEDASSTVAAEDPLAGLHACIQSLGIELNDTIIGGLFQQINALRQKWSNRPLEKTFLQLLSTIAQHIDRYRFEASSEALNLLTSVYTALAARREDDIQYCLELLLAENLKVLEWQQEMLTRQAVQKGVQLTFTAPVQSEGEEVVESAVDARLDFDQQLQQYEESDEEAGFSAGEPLAAVSEPQAARESLATELKQEIASLRLTLQQEIAELRSDLKGK